MCNWPSGNDRGFFFAVLSALKVQGSIQGRLELSFCCFYLSARCNHSIQIRCAARGSMRIRITCSPARSLLSCVVIVQAHLVERLLQDVWPIAVMSETDFGVCTNVDFHFHLFSAIHRGRSAALETLHSFCVLESPFHHQHTTLTATYQKYVL